MSVRRTQASLRLPAEVALVAVSVAALVGFRRLFVDWSFLVQPLCLLVVSHVVAGVLRARRVPLVVAAVISTVIGAVLLSWVFYQHTLRFGLPTPTTLSAVGTDLRAALDLFRDVKAPAEVMRGFVFATAASFWAAAFLADWAAFRLDAAVEATVPAGGLFVFAALFGADGLRLQLTLVFGFSCLVFVLLHRSARQEVGMPWVRGDARRGSRAYVRGGAVLASVGVLVGLAIAPLVPGAESTGLVNWKEIGARQGTRITVSPLVDIQSRLVNQRDNVAFTVRSERRAYWRLTALDSFDGTVWRSSQRFSRVENELPAVTGAAGRTEPVVQDFTIRDLSQIWLPAAFQPKDIEIDGVLVRWESSTSTLIVDKDTSNGLEYSVVSELPDVDADQLAGAPATVPEAIRDQYLGLPAEISPRVIELAQGITAGAGGAYEQAIALQDFFRSGEFTYSTDVQKGHSDDRLVDFLFTGKIGYCEQYAGAYAAMARAVGLPARVAVGFTPGDVDPDDPTLYTVLGKHAHAWPEVYINGYGWVLFEPTPGRGAPNAGYTGVGEEQDPDSTSPATDGETATTETSVTTSAAASSSDGLDDAFPEGGTASGAAAPASQDSRGSRAAATLGWIVLVVVGAAALYGGVVLGGGAALRGWRRRRAVTPRQQIDLAWDEAVDSVRVLGIMAQPSETPTEFADRAVRRGRLTGEGLDELARMTTEARYAPTEALVPEVATEAGRTSTAVLDAVRERTTLGQRLGYRLSPKAMVGRLRSR